ncbi:LYAR-type C2HC zinc finger [Zalerion maritima]|uniref:LYAR-type C2HC zinc finger n=1 Tax=Zalerion maritima TaxID=339359 RepID=A0AAD5RNS5_9PEZI|nr:LYAR-type C2HC zinc finger [Zalerion maritima]
MTEAQKYQGSLYKNKNNKNNNHNNNPQQQNRHKKVKLEDPVTPIAFTKPHDNKMSHRAYVEELPDEPFDVHQFLQPGVEDDEGVPPAAPSPPSARPLKENTINVFDFMVGTVTPNLSNANIPGGSSPTPPPEETNELVRYDFEANGFVDPEGARDENGNVPFVEYGSGEIPTTKLKTPAPGAHRKPKDKKRKHLHIDTNSPLHEPHRDEEMVDAPPVLHSGLTGGLNRLTVFPPSPDFSGGDGNEPSTSSPIKKKKAQKAAKQHAKSSKHAKARPESGGIFSRLKSYSNTTTAKTKKRKTVSSPPKPKKSSSNRQRRHTHSHDKPTKAIEYKSDRKGEKQGSNAMIVYHEPVDLFMSLVHKGPESERGCSLNKALKRFHRERQESSDCRGKVVEEKDLFKSLRMKRNDRGEIVLFSIPDEFKDLL